jgi:hypothetical protein
MEEEPIALSDDELDHILADAEASHSEPAPELIPETQDEILTLADEPELTLRDDVDSPPEAGAEDIRPQERAENDGFFDSDDDEPITLSDEELDSILSTAPEEPTDSDEVRLAEGMQQESRVVEDEEPITLSHEELDGILMDANETTAEDEIPASEEAPAPADSQGFFDSDEDEPITLSADELEGITATATPEADASEQAEASADMDSRYADIDQMAEPVADAELAAPVAVEAGEKAETTFDDEDEGPIALTADELDGIVADAQEVTPEAPMVGLSPLDATPAEPSLAEQQKEKPATVFEEDLEAATLIHEDDQAKPQAAAPLPDAEELKSVLAYLDNLLGELPDDVIEKFAQSEYFKLYQKIMDKLGL